MAAYCCLDDLQFPAGCLPVHRDQLQAQRSVTSMGSLYLYLLLALAVGQRRIYVTFVRFLQTLFVTNHSGFMIFVD